ncbi:hypothetical protein [Haliangium ochraceum]|uniref:Uncharacterized protein n=1 Tax=Haliangium ochraceum (strain DSM 14365 / JCM 11303 / SMP-2) TaxID=502025 RepID=D0LW13_HALO1|nr:hypothetical protein [Haliangium ochraceum]ACY14147.1 hypothetical protein Hoch_1597 [Haliangium ochraceum DSM 14365]
MSSSKTCHHETLARNKVAHVQRCGHCGAVSIHLGPMTVRLDDSALDALAAVTAEASGTLHARSFAAPLGTAPRGLA